MPTVLADLPLLVRLPVLGAVTCGSLGAVVGLAVGLNVYAPTAWAAALELGAPSALLGAVLGVVSGSVSRLVSRQRVRNH